MLKKHRKTPALVIIGFVLVTSVGFAEGNVMEKIYVEKVTVTYNFIIPPVGLLTQEYAAPVIYYGGAPISQMELLELSGLSGEVTRTASTKGAVITWGLISFVAGGISGGFLISENQLSAGIPLAVVSFAGIVATVVGILMNPVDLSYEQAREIADMYNRKL